MIKIANPLDAFNVSNGAFNADLLYTSYYKLIPSRYDIDIEDKNQKIDVSKINIKSLYEFFDEKPFVKIYGYSEINDPENIDDAGFSDYNGVIRFTDEPAGSIVMLGSQRIICIHYNCISIYFNYEEEVYNDIVNLAYKIFNMCPKIEKESLEAKIGLINVSQGDYYTQISKINKTSLDIDKYYNDDFKPIFNDIKEFLHRKGSGLIMLHGKIGTGKSNLIRYLCSEFPAEYIIVPNSIAARLGDPELISFITNNKNSIFILEDCEQLLEDRSENMFNNAITTILNMSDGLLSDVVNIKLICTFNADITKIDPALLRKGRCIADYEFKELSANKVAKLNEEFNLGIKDIRDMTLAEIFNHDSADYTKSELKIGF